MRLGLIAPAAALLLVWGVQEAAAQQWIQKTASDSVLIEGVFYPRVTFSVWNPGSAVTLVGAHRLASTGPGDTCSAIRAVGPANWAAGVDPAHGTALWGAMYSPIPAADGYLSGFQLVLTQGHSSCFEFNFDGPLDEPYAYETACFGADQPVPVARRTWGALKSLYR